MGCLFDYFRVCIGDVPAAGIASNGLEPDGAPRMGNSLAELCSHFRDGGIGRPGAVRAGRTLFPAKQCRAAGSHPYGSRRHENEKLARNGRDGDGFNHGFALLLIEAR